jgi:hypothetical protein
MSDVHVVPSIDEWAVELDGEQRATYNTQNEAITRGGQLAGEEGEELVIHGKDGQIREKHSHGNDPRNIPG